MPTALLAPAQAIKLASGYQVPFAEQVKAEIGLPTIAVGLITEPEQADEIIAKGQAEAVALARAVLHDPRWAWPAAAKFEAQVSAPKQYWRCQPREFRSLFRVVTTGQR